MFKLLLLEAAITAPELDSDLLPVSMGCCSRVEAVSDELPDGTGQLLNGVTDAKVSVPGRASIERLL
jgi:hypothetical protein